MAGRPRPPQVPQEPGDYPEIAQYFRMLVLPTALLGYNKKRVIDALQCLDGLYKSRIAELKEEFARKIAWEISGREEKTRPAATINQSGKGLGMKERMEFQQLKKIGKNDLLRLLQECDDENRKLKAENEAGEKKIQELKNLIGELEEEKRKLRTSYTEPGSLAESMLQVNGVMEAAQKTADQYIARIRELEADRQREADKIVEAARGRAEQILTQAKTGAQRMKAASTNVLKTLQDEIDRMLVGARGAFEQKGEMEELPGAPVQPQTEELGRVPHLNEILGSGGNAAETPPPASAVAVSERLDIQETVPSAAADTGQPASPALGTGTQEYAQYEAFLEEVDKFTANLNDEIKSAMDDITNKTQQPGN
ncbi:hypothetical protein A5N82_03935 [Christensenella minuta]|uniref:Uncharacterized protein n=2 Tax=Christensenella minuta TaxID=626937 RepID=A0A136Q403_9FIRM|nr:hypothetical protein [Christensenella minuta]AYH40949.1 hypothetical protein B1H56_10775 [Christensenella minuta]KXK65367.1 hypothetical protein HMPREF3293_01579 [Christensenella minuta]OAQ42527.1 hypothetical protein A5N82_03935 [Christensenella minuta]